MEAPNAGGCASDVRYRCYAPLHFAHLGWRQGLVQEISNGSAATSGSNVWHLCGYLFRGVSEAHTAWGILAHGVKVALKAHSVNPLRLTRKFGDERIAYTTTGSYTLVVRRRNAVLVLGFVNQGGTLYTPAQFSDLGEVLTLRLRG